MKDRFEGPEGQRRLNEVLKTQRLVEHDAKFAEALASKGEVVEFKPGDKIITQGATDNDVYLILDGDAGIYINGRQVATRGPRDAVGEMTLIDARARRSADVAAHTPLTAFKVKEPDFQALLTAFPQVWRAVALVLADRLRERAQFHREPNVIPALFVGCSVEGLPVAQEIQLGLKHNNITVRPWTTPGVFGPGGVSIDSLLKEVDASDFAAFVFGPDDKVFSRHERYEAPRDNTVFELGLFMGRLDRNRAFIVKEHSTEIKIPTDLLGVTPITYVHRPGEDLSASIACICTELRKVIGSLGVR
jgi:predicted nucleotide-binding protein